MHFTRRLVQEDQSAVIAPYRELGVIGTDRQRKDRFRLRGVGVSLDHPLGVPGFDSSTFADGIKRLAVSAINQLDHRLFVSEHGLDNPSTTR